MAATVDTESIEKEVLILRATGDETVSFLQKYPVQTLEDSFSLKLYRQASSTSDPVEMQVNYDFLLDHEKGQIDYLVELNEEEQVYIEEYEYETTYFKYLSSFRSSIGDDNFENIRYTTNTLISYFHKAIFEKIVPMSDWEFTLDTDVNRIEEDITDVQLGFIVDFAALILQRAELKQALRRAIVIADRSSKLDTTRHLKVLQDQVIHDEKELKRLFNEYLITSQIADGSLVLAIKSSIKSRSLYLYDNAYVLGG